MRFGGGARGLERLAGGSSAGARGPSTPSRWRTLRAGPDPWSEATGGVGDQDWLRRPAGNAAREALQQTLLFPATRALARPRVTGADDLHHTPQPAVLAANHASDVDTPLILAALPRAWRTRTLVGAAEDRFYRRRRYALATGLWINTFPFDRAGAGRGLARAAALLADGHNVLLYPQATRSQGALTGFRAGVARLCLAAGVPALPVHVGGTALIMPKDRGITQRGRATVRFGAPVYPAPGEEPVAFAARVREAISELASRRR